MQPPCCRKAGGHARAMLANSDIGVDGGELRNIVIPGLACAAFTLLWSVVCNLGGEGWATCVPYGVATFIAFPVTFYAIATRANAGLLLIVLAGGVLDMSLYRQTLADGVDYFTVTGQFGWAWVAMFLSWQAAALVFLVRNLVSPPNDEGAVDPE